MDLLQFSFINICNIFAFVPFVIFGFNNDSRVKSHEEIIKKADVSKNVIWNFKH